jgi:hypothetical protein
VRRFEELKRDIGHADLLQGATERLGAEVEVVLVLLAASM